VPSRYEGFGLCAAEGLAAGRPVLVADAGALPELAGATVLPVDDAAAWAAAIATPPPPPARRQAADDLAMNTLQVWRSLRAQPTSCMTR
jgi:glycosyltransferase involved in cell wall biosynthesis